MEGQLLRACLALSLLAHAVVYVGLQRFPLSGERLKERGDEVAITALLEYEWDAKSPSIRASKQSEEIRVAKQTLPQLTKELTTSAQPAKKVPGGPTETNRPAMTDDRPPSSPKKGRRLDPKEQKAAEIAKLEALQRLLKEKARQDKKFAQQDHSPRNKVLAKRQQQLEERQLLQEQLALTSGAKYAGKIRQWVKRHYSVPEVYRLQQRAVKAVVYITLDRSGGLKALKLKESSGDPAFDSLALRALESSAPFPKPPPEWVGKTVAYAFSAGG
jgi:TonB family protein